MEDSINEIKIRISDYTQFISAVGKEIFFFFNQSSCKVICYLFFSWLQIQVSVLTDVFWGWLISGWTLHMHVKTALVMQLVNCCYNITFRVCHRNLRILNSKVFLFFFLVSLVSLRCNYANSVWPVRRLWLWYPQCSTCVCKRSFCNLSFLQCYCTVTSCPVTETVVSTALEVLQWFTCLQCLTC